VQEKSVDRVDRSPKLSRASIPHEPDIPEALRESSFVQPSHQRFTTLKSLFNSSLLRWGLLGGAIALCISFFQPSFSYILSALPAAIRNASAIVRSQPEVGSATLRSPASTPDPRQSTLPQPTQPFLASPSSSRQALSLTSPLLGHFPYKEVPLQTLQLVVADGSIKLRQAAAAKFLEMVAEAKAERIVLIPISGFRSIADQEYLFFDVKAQQGQGATQRAEVIAPPGYSEHHTGYAIDLGDGFYPDTKLQISFEKTAAFRWLQRNAARFNFEMSFPKNNPQGVSYEPWHWRFVGDRDSLELFYQVRSPAVPATSTSASPASLTIP
jgi:zinc D-Ala-D-Ala carboxypeptidase